MRESGAVFCQPTEHHTRGTRFTEHVSSLAVAQCVKNGVKPASVVDSLLKPHDIFILTAACVFLTPCVFESLPLFVSIRRGKDKD